MKEDKGKPVYEPPKIIPLSSLKEGGGPDGGEPGDDVCQTGTDGNTPSPCSTGNSESGGGNCTTGNSPSCEACNSGTEPNAFTDCETGNSPTGSYCNSGSAQSSPGSPAPCVSGISPQSNQRCSAGNYGEEGPDWVIVGEL